MFVFQKPPPVKVCVNIANVDKSFFKTHNSSSHESVKNLTKADKKQNNQSRGPRRFKRHKIPKRLKYKKRFKHAQQTKNAKNA